MSKTIAKLAMAAALLLPMTTATPVAHARLLRRPPTMISVPRPSSGGPNKTLDDMVPGSCCCGSGNETLCTGKDGHSYACNTATKVCMAL